MSAPKGMNRPQADRDILLKLLQFADLTAAQRSLFQAALLGLDTGIERRLAKTTRDHGVAILRAQKLLPPQPESSPKRVGVWEEDRFSAVPTAGTKFAAELLAKPLPKKPPGRKAS